MTDNFYKTLLDSIFDAVYTIDSQGIISYWNDSCTRITGYSTEEIVGQHFTMVPFAYNHYSDSRNLRNNHKYKEHSNSSGNNKSSHYDPDAGSGHQQGINIVMKNGTPGTWKGFIRRKNGQKIPIESHLSPIRDEAGNVTGVIEVFRDISAQIALEDAHRQVLQVSRKDQLTSLFNRTATNEILKAEIERSRRYQQNLSVVMVDIDHFKRVNDNYGHDAGDKVLARVAALLTYNLRKPDVAGRWGGEEFLIIAPGNDAESASQLADRIRKYIRQANIEEVPEHITASFGVSQLHNGMTVDQLLYRADMALYQAKENGRDQVEIAKTQE